MTPNDDRNFVFISRGRGQSICHAKNCLEMRSGYSLFGNKVGQQGHDKDSRDGINMAILKKIRKFFKAILICGGKSINDRRGMIFLPFII